MQAAHPDGLLVSAGHPARVKWNLPALRARLEAWSQEMDTLASMKFMGSELASSNHVTRKLDGGIQLDHLAIQAYGARLLA